MTPSERPPSSRERRPIHVFAAGGWTMLLSVLVILVLELVATARGGMLDLVSQTMGSALSYSLVLFVMLRVYAPSSPMRDALAFRGVSPLHLLLSAVAGAGVAPALSKLDALVMTRFPLAPDEVELNRQFLATRPVVIVIMLVVISPIADELFFRGMLFTGTRRGRSAGFAWLATSLLFAVAPASNGNFDPRGAASAFVLALVLGWLRAQSGSVVSALAGHLAFAAATYVPLAIGRDAPGDVPLQWVPMKWIAIAMGSAICALLAGSLASTRDRAATAARAADE